MYKLFLKNNRFQVFSQELSIPSIANMHCMQSGMLNSETISKELSHKAEKSSAKNKIIEILSLYIQSGTNQTPHFSEIQ